MCIKQDTHLFLYFDLGSFPPVGLLLRGLLIFGLCGRFLERAALLVLDGRRLSAEKTSTCMYTCLLLCFGLRMRKRGIQYIVCVCVSVRVLGFYCVLQVACQSLCTVNGRFLCTTVVTRSNQ